METAGFQRKPVEPNDPMNDCFGSNPAVKSAQDAAYRMLIYLSSGHLESQGRQSRLVPGMQVNAEIHLGTRSVLEYLLSPIQKVAHEAWRER